VPPPAEGTVTISGFYHPEFSHFSAHAYAARPFGGLPDPYFQLFVLGDRREPDQRLIVWVGSPLAVGTFSSSAQQMGADLWVKRFVGETLSDAELTISAIEPSDTDVSVVHGTFRATFLHVRTPGVVEATF
jgi:hypothetical protein